MNPSAARLQLLAQHERLRAMLLKNRALARRLLSGEPVTFEFDASLRALRDAYALHSSFERSVLEPILRDADAWGPARVARMSEEHRAEHAALEELRVGTVRDVALRFDDLAELLDAHMAAEERTFLSAQVLRRDVVSGRGPGADVNERPVRLRAAGR